MEVDTAAAGRPISKRRRRIPVPRRAPVGPNNQNAGRLASESEEELHKDTAEESAAAAHLDTATESSDLQATYVASQSEDAPVAADVSAAIAERRALRQQLSQQAAAIDQLVRWGAHGVSFAPIQTAGFR